MPRMSKRDAAAERDRVVQGVSKHLGAQLRELKADLEAVVAEREKTVYELRVDLATARAERGQAVLKTAHAETVSRDLAKGIRALLELLASVSEEAATQGHVATQISIKIDAVCTLGHSVLASVKVPA